ncbi:hypothetical protein ACQEVF_45620 [Nonomuraea polychroma]|uniref:hypothetical protein n=1 Tax=Nonomuraea polychroma TaxID=46176 RepID=UPI003D8DEDB4
MDPEQILAGLAIGGDAHEVDVFDLAGLKSRPLRGPDGALSEVLQAEEFDAVRGTRRTAGVVAHCGDTAEKERLDHESAAAALDFRGCGECVRAWAQKFTTKMSKP